MGCGLWSTEENQREEKVRAAESKRKGGCLERKLL